MQARIIYTLDSIRDLIKADLERRGQSYAASTLGLAEDMVVLGRVRGCGNNVTQRLTIEEVQVNHWIERPETDSEPAQKT